MWVACIDASARQAAAQAGRWEEIALMMKRARSAGAVEGGGAKGLLDVPLDAVGLIVEELVRGRAALAAIHLLSTCRTLHRLSARWDERLRDAVIVHEWLRDDEDELYCRLASSIIAGTARWFESGEDFEKRRRQRGTVGGRAAGLTRLSLQPARALQCLPEPVRLWDAAAR